MKVKKMKHFLSIAVTLFLLLFVFACSHNDPEAIAEPEPEVGIELVEGASFELMEDIGVAGSAFYLYSPSNPHDFSLLSGFLNSVIFIYPDEPYADEDAALEALDTLGLIDLAEETPAYIIMPMPLDSQGWTADDLELYYESQFYLAGGNVTLPDAPGQLPITEYERRTYNTLQYVIAEGSGATFVNNTLSQNAGRIAGILTFGGEIQEGLDIGYAVPAYLVDAGGDAVEYWKAANGVDIEAVPNIFINSDYVQKKVVVAEGSSTFHREIFTDAWSLLLSRSTRGCVTDDVVANTKVLGEWVLMTWPNLDELGLNLTSHTYEDFLVHDFVPDAVVENPDTQVPLVLVLHGMGDDPLYTVNGCGWANKAVEENFVIVAPDYTPDNPDFLISVVEYATSTYPIDETRIYVTGFSMGGMTSGLMGLSNPDIFAAMSPMGATGNVYPDADAVTYDIPFCIIVGGNDFHNVTINGDGDPVVSGIIPGALEANLDFNEINYGTADYAANPYWGYTPDAFYSLTDKELTFEISDFDKAGYTNPIAQLVTFIGAGHANADTMSTIAWDFMRQFARSGDGSVIEP